MTNSTLVKALTPLPVPSDRECVSNLSSILQGVSDYMEIAGLQSEIGSGSGLVPTNNTAAQALALAQKVDQELSLLSQRVPHYRSSAVPVALVAGNQVVPITFTDIGTTDYLVNVTVFGTSTSPSVAFSWSPIDASRTSNSVQIRFDHIPSGSSFIWSIQTVTTG